ncbi:hypothetical protein [Paenibacillus sp. 32352]|uniref:hypothetical protein n=1 Tax=Paenibacillus sp. 32352 TaxID=1969111 RepID=UPI00117E0AF2|nr:hypothetical protein [Paenibacillus sp. 32352]
MNKPVMKFADRWKAAEKLVTEQLGIERIGLRLIGSDEVTEYQRQDGVRGIKLAVDHYREGTTKPDGISIYFHFDDGQDVMVIQQLA